MNTPAIKALNTLREIAADHYDYKDTATDWHTLELQIVKLEKLATIAKTGLEYCADVDNTPTAKLALKMMKEVEDEYDQN